MSALYFVDLFANPFTTTKIIDVLEGPSAYMTGTVVIRVPDYISVQNPIDASDLITKKHLGMLAYYAGYANIHFDDLMDLGDVDLTAPNVGGSFGERNQITVFPGQRFVSQMVGLVGPNPPQVIITWETYEAGVLDPSTDRTQQGYVEFPSTPSYFTCEVSFDNGGHFYPTTDGGLLNIPLIGQGTQFIIRLTNTSGFPIRLLRVGSWAVIY